MTTKEYLTTEEIALKLIISEETVRRYIRQGDLRALKLRGVYRVRREDFERFLENHMTKKQNHQ